MVKALITVVSLVVSAGLAAGREPSEVISLWPDLPPGEKATSHEEHDTTKASDGLVAGKALIRLGDVSKPTLAVYRPRPGTSNGSAVMICPGGGYYILAMDLEGTEVCEWLNSLGVTALLLKYRVPKREGMEKHAAALQDAQRAMGLARRHAHEWGFATNRLGALGFSAGAHLAAVLSNQFHQRSYAKIDEADELSCRPDFALLIYPAYLTVKEQGDTIAPELTVSSNSPPTFLTMAEDDPVRVESALFYGLALHKVNVPFEVHIYPTGGHGYGLRRTQEPVTTWPDRAADWLRHRRLLKAN